MRKIIHIDMDCFYAAIEQRDDPDLAHLPVAVGGRPHGRGVIATCNYAARRFGVHSAMPSAQAARLCPDLVFVKPNIAKYKQESQKIREIFYRYTDKVEPLSLDEAYLDVTDCAQYQNSATWIAQAICRDIFAETQLTASAGVAATKFLAKVASDWNKPNGIQVVPPDQQDAFIEKLPVKKLFGVGKVMTAKLEAMDIFDCRDLRKIPLETLIKRFGKMGKYLFDLSRGVDDREVKQRSNRKSISVETTLSDNISEWNDCENTMHRLISSLSRRIGDGEQVEKIRKVYVKTKSDTFESHSAESITIGLDIGLIMRLLKRLRKQYPAPLRLMGVGVRFPDKPLKDGFQQIDIPF